MGLADLNVPPSLVLALVGRMMTPGKFSKGFGCGLTTQEDRYIRSSRNHHNRRIIIQKEQGEMMVNVQPLAENNVQESTILIEPENFNGMLLLLTV
jgi:hypothetical protein